MIRHRLAAAAFILLGDAGIASAYQVSNPWSVPSAGIASGHIVESAGGQNTQDGGAIGSAANKSTGTSVADPGTGALELLLKNQSVTGAARSFGAGDLQKVTRRSNSGSAMTDTFPISSATGLSDGALIVLDNVDTNANDNVMAGSGTTINGGSTYAIGPGRSVLFRYLAASTDWRPLFNTGTALLAPNNLSDVASASNARTNLGLAAMAQVASVTISGDVSGSGTSTISATIGNNAVANGKAAQMPANTLKGNNTGITANQADLTPAQVNVMLSGGVFLYGCADNVNFNATGDTTIVAPAGLPVSAYRLQNILVYGVSGAFGTAKAGIYTAASQGGLALTGAQQTIGLTATGIDTVGALATLSLGSAVPLDKTSLYVNVGTPQGAAAIGTVCVFVNPIS